MTRIAVSLTLACVAIACSFETSPTASGTFAARAEDVGSRDGSAVLDASAGDTTLGGATRAGAGSAQPPDGSVPPNACGGPCPHDSPVCLPSSGWCVQCASDANCSTPAEPACDVATHTCVACSEDAQCGASTPRCDRAAHACVQCLEDADCTDPAAPRCDPGRRACVGCFAHADCGGVAPVCDPQAQQCVECLSHADCGDLTRPQCRDRLCVPCASADACAGRGGATVCDTGGPPTGGACVQCTVGDEAPCGGTVCDPESLGCTDRPLASQDTCQFCIADSECLAGHRCIAMEYGGVPLPGGACLRAVGSGCERPYAAAPINRASRSGAAPQDYCGIDEAETTCAAIAALIAHAECPAGEDAECGAQGGICRSVNGVDDRCTYPCGASAECPSGFQCDEDYCGSSTGGGGGPGPGGGGG